MAAFADDFDDGAEDDESSPLLPREDRLWRHPSELGGGSIASDPLAIRHRWLTSRPSRASAWTAGLVGALLATGLVALGTHLATAITSPPASDGASPHTTPTVLDSASAFATRALAPPMVASLAMSIKRIDASMVMFSAMTGSTHMSGIGLIVGADGTIVVPAEALEHASDILVTLPGSGIVDVGHVVGIDAPSGIAVLKIEGLSSLPTINLDGSTGLAPSSYALALSGPASGAANLGVVNAVDVAPTSNGDSLVDAMETNLTTSQAPLGSVLMDAHGNIAGIITGADKSGAVATPSWLASPVIAELMTEGSVDHGWLGIDATNITAANGAHQVQVLSVTSNSAAARAGIHRGDLINVLNGKPVSSVTELRGQLYVLKPGTSVNLSIERATKHLRIHVVLDDHTT